MNPDWKKKWLAALRSGAYKQGRGYLRRKLKDVDLYCCLGVLGNLADPNEWSKSPLCNGAYLHGQGYQNLSYDIFEQVGLPHEESDHLVDMNDAGNSFTTIARYIEEKF